MSDAEVLAELRSLQERAYGRAGGLSESDAARLRRLEGLPIVERTSATAEESPVVERERAATAAPLAVERESAAATEMSRGVLDGAEQTHVSSRLARSTTDGLRPRRILLAAVILATLIGVLIGWAVFSPRGSQTVPLSAEQQSWQDEILVTGVYDQGSVRPIAEEDGTIVWFATRNGGDIVCAIISDGETTAPACRERDAAITRGLQTSLRREVEGGEGLVEAQILFDTEGDPAVLTSHSLIGGGAGGAHATEAEQSTAETLIASGYAPTSLTVVGHDEDVPIWIGLHLDAGRWCLIYDGSTTPLESACDDGAALNGGGTLELTHLDVEAATSTTIEYRFGPGSPYLEITRNSDGSAS